MQQLLHSVQVLSQHPFFFPFCCSWSPRFITSPTGDADASPAASSCGCKGGRLAGSVGLVTTPGVVARPWCVRSRRASVDAKGALVSNTATAVFLNMEFDIILAGAYIRS